MALPFQENPTSHHFQNLGAFSMYALSSQSILLNIAFLKKVQEKAADDFETSASVWLCLTFESAISMIQDTMHTTIY